MNLLQISSAMGKTMEALDHTQMIEAVYTRLLNMDDHNQVIRITNMVANGYPFPTNLDSNPPEANGYQSSR